MNRHMKKSLKGMLIIEDGKKVFFFLNKNWNYLFVGDRITVFDAWSSSNFIESCDKVYYNGKEIL